jgi:hypothetical protein
LLINRNWSLQGFTDADPYGVMLPYPDVSCDRFCPFSYLLALVDLAQRKMPDTLPIPKLDRTSNLRTELLQSITRHSPSEQLRKLRNTQLSTISLWTLWLHPLIDFSIPSDRVYQSIPAWKLLDASRLAEFSHLSQQIVVS